MLLITNGCIITMNERRTIYHDGTLAIEGSQIIDLGESALLKAKYPQAKVLDARDKIIIPGLINAHTHLFQVLYRGLGDDVSLLDWLNKCIWPMSLYLKGAEAYQAAMRHAWGAGPRYGRFGTSAAAAAGKRAPSSKRSGADY